MLAEKGDHHHVLIERRDQSQDDRLPQPGPWVVWRQDDTGNRFEVARRDSRAEADALAEMMERRGHKQTYWVARAD